MKLRSENGDGEWAPSASPSPPPHAAEPGCTNSAAASNACGLRFDGAGRARRRREPWMRRVARRICSARVCAVGAGLLCVVAASNSSGALAAGTARASSPFCSLRSALLSTHEIFSAVEQGEPKRAVRALAPYSERRRWVQWGLIVERDPDIAGSRRATIQARSPLTFRRALSQRRGLHERLRIVRLQLYLTSASKTNLEVPFTLEFTRAADDLVRCAEPRLRYRQRRILMPVREDHLDRGVSHSQRNADR